jgi:predicted glycosyltransferase
MRVAFSDKPESGCPTCEGRLARKRRIALYSHDTMGIGHMRRNLLIAEALSGGPCPAVILLIAGACEVNAFQLPPAVDCLSLPAFYKEGNGQYRARRLEISLDELLSLRAHTIAATLNAFAPDLLIVDKVPRGAMNELDPSLENLRAGGLTRCVLGLRDVLDDPETVRHEWREAANEEVIHDYYDAVWVYGDPTVYDPVSEYALAPETAAKVRYTGYLDYHRQAQASCPADAELLAPLLQSAEPIVLCMVGGGQDGADLADAFAQAVLPPATRGVLLTGPFMPPAAQERLQLRAACNPRLQVIKFLPQVDLLLRRADRIIAMGGYNTVCEILSFEKPALIVPRVKPRREQWIRAERLRALGLLEVLHPEALTPQALTEWLARAPALTPPGRGRIDLQGLTNLPRLMDEVLGTAPCPPAAPPLERSMSHAAW